MDVQKVRVGGCCRLRIVGPAAGVSFRRSGGASNGQAVDAQGGLPDTDGDALAFFAAGANSGVELKVVTDHGDAGEGIGPVADDGGAFDGVLDFAVFDPVGFRGGKYEFATGDVDLTSAEIGGIKSFFEGGDDFLGVFVATQHEGVGHAGQWCACIAFAARIACGFCFHQAGVEGVAEVAFQDSVFNEDVALCGCAFVVDVQGATAVGNGAVVEDGDARGGNTLTNAVAECAGAFAVKVAFEAVAYGFMDEYAWPAWAEDDVHEAGWRRPAFEVG